MKITFQGGDEDNVYRSRLEREVAQEMTRLGIAWSYEMKVELPGGRTVPYLPDFTLFDAPDELEMTVWVECKPQQMLYQLRDATGVTRRAGEYFKADVIVEGITSADLMDMGLDELAKPKRLAELSRFPLLVVGGVGGTNKLSVCMHHDQIVFSRSHPFVNQRGVELRAERENRAEERRQEAERWRAEYERKERERQEGQGAIRSQNVRNIIQRFTGVAPRFASRCHGCLTHGEDGKVYRVRFDDRTERWERICEACEASARAWIGRHA